MLSPPSFPLFAPFAVLAAVPIRKIELYFSLGISTGGDINVFVPPSREWLSVFADSRPPKRLRARHIPQTFYFGSFSSSVLSILKRKIVSKYCGGSKSLPSSFNNWTSLCRRIFPKVLLLSFPPSILKFLSPNSRRNSEERGAHGDQSLVARKQGSLLKAT